MKILILFLFVAFFAVTPVYLLDNLVMPQLLSLQDAYSSYDATAQQIADAK